MNQPAQPWVLVTLLRIPVFTPVGGVRQMQKIEPGDQDVLGTPGSGSTEEVEEFGEAEEVVEERR